MKILYIGNIPANSMGGADVVNKRNYTLLEEISNGKIDVIELNVTSAKDKLFLGISSQTIKEIENALSRKNYTHVFFSQSLYGRAVKFIRKKFPYIPIFVFCHNVEVDYAMSYLRTSGLKALPFYLVVKKWEKEAINNSSAIITLNSRDSKRFKEVYGKDAAFELPTSFKDVFMEEKANQIIAKNNQSRIDYLFVGVSFFANVQGCQWFIDNVLPYVHGNFYIVGKGMDKIQFKNLSDRIYLKGFVDDLSEYYYRAKMIVSPIFTGAGMKTKTAEALMYGKTIIGTTEAFEGYKLDNRCMKLANSKKQFIDAIQTVEADNTFPNINPYARAHFLANHENSVFISKLKNLFIS